MYYLKAEHLQISVAVAIPWNIPMLKHVAAPREILDTRGHCCHSLRTSCCRSIVETGLISNTKSVSTRITTIPHSRLKKSELSDLTATRSRAALERLFTTTACLPTCLTLYKRIYCLTNKYGNNSLQFLR